MYVRIKITKKKISFESLTDEKRKELRVASSAVGQLLVQANRGGGDVTLATNTKQTTLRHIGDRNPSHNGDQVAD